MTLPSPSPCGCTPPTRHDMRRQVRVMTMGGLAKFGATAKGPIPDLLEPELLTFCSDRGMMVCGFEEIGGRRYYQGWWMQWLPYATD